MRRTSSFRNPRSAFRNCVCLSLLLAASALLLALSGPAPAATYYWDSNGATAGFGNTAGTWGTSTFWSTNSAGTAATANTTITTSDGVNFGTSTLALGATASTIGVAAGGVSVNSITFGSAQATAVTLGTAGNTITLGGTTPTITVNNTSDTISSLLANSTTLTKAGAGTLILTADNDAITGTTTVSDGTLRLGQGGRLNNSDITIDSGKTLNLLTTGAAGTSRDQLGVTGTTLVINGTLSNTGTNESRLQSSTITMNNGTITASSTADLGFGSFLVDLSRTITANGASNTINGTSGIGLGGVSQILTFDTPTASDALVVSTPLGASSALTGGLTKTGAGTVKLTGDSTFTGAININAGQLWLDDDGDLVSSTINVNSGGTFRFGEAESGNPNLPSTTFINVNTGGTIIWETGEAFGGVNLNGGSVQVVGATAGINLQGTSTWQSGTITGTSAPQFSGVGVIDKTNTGTVTITGMALNTTGAINIQNGVLATDSDLTSAGTLTIGTGSTAGTLQLTTTTVSPTYARPVTLNGAGTIDVTNSGTTVTLSGTFTGTNKNFTKTGSGTLVISGNADLGNVTVNGGTLKSAAGGGNFYNGSVTVSGGGTLDLVDNGDTGAGAITLIDGTITGTTANISTSSGGISLQKGTISIVIDGAVGGVTKTTPDTVTLSGANTYTQNTTVNDGILQITGTASNSAIGGWNVTHGELQFGKTSGAKVAGALETPVLTIGNDSGANDSAIVTLTLSSNQFPTGAIGVGVGNIGVQMSDDGLLNLAGFSETIGDLNSAVTETQATIKAGSGTPTLTVGNGNFAGEIVDGGGILSLTKNRASANLTLQGTNTYSGTTTINAGQLIALGGSAIGDSSPVVLANTAGASLVLSSSETVGSLAGGGASGGDIQLSANTLTAGGNGASTTYAGVISGTGGSLTKTGAGTLELTGDNTYTGATIINSGTLWLNGTAGFSHSGSGAYNVGNGGTLKGDGNLVGHAVTFATGSSGAPGNSPGLMPTGSQSWDDGATYQWEVAQAGTAGVDYDSYAVSGLLDFSAISGTMNLDLIKWFPGGSFTATDSFALWTYTSLNGWDTGAGIGNPSGLFTLTNPGGYIDFSNAIIYADNVGGAGTIWLTGIFSVPEPSTWALALVGLAGLGLVVWRKRK